MNTLFGLLEGKESNQIRGKKISIQMALGASGDDFVVVKVSTHDREDPGNKDPIS